VNNIELKHHMHEDLQHFSKEFYLTSIHCLTQRWKKCTGNEGGLWSNNLSLVKEVSMIYLNFIVIVSIVSEKERGSITVCTDLLVYVVMSYYRQHSVCGTPQAAMQLLDHMQFLVPSTQLLFFIEMQQLCTFYVQIHGFCLTHGSCVQYLYYYMVAT